MTINLIKMSVGVEDVQHLERKQKQSLFDLKCRGDKEELIHFTRNTPRRATELLNGGSIYWVIRRLIQVRQLIIDIRQVEGIQGNKSWAIILNPRLIKTETRKIRAFQGWRYFLDNDAPADLQTSIKNADNAPSELIYELKELGLL